MAASGLTRHDLHGVAGVDVQIVDTKAVITAYGEFDIATAQLLRDGFAWAQAQHRNVVLDAHDVSFIDATALNELLVAEVRLAEQGHQLQVSHPPRLLRRVA